MKDIQIDWSKAPEGATHYLPGRHCPWYMLSDGGWKYWTGWIWGHVDPSRPEVESMIPRPASWNGEGLPPVGTVCEVAPKFINRGTRVRIVAHDGAAAVGRYLSAERLGSYNSFEVGELVPSPAPSPEQIAAEAREKAIEAMCAHFMRDSGDPIPVIDACSRLYDHGYRKVEGGAQ